MERKQIEKPISVVKEFAFPPQVGVSDFNVWDEVEPPGGTFLITRYDRSTIPSPVRPAGYAAAPAIAVQGFNRAMNPTMRAKLHNGLTIKHATRRATRELEEFDH